MKYYALRGRALSESLRLRFERHDDAVYTKWAVNIGKGKTVGEMPYGATLYKGGRRADFEDVLNGADRLPVFSERAIEVMQPFLRGPDDIEWLYVPQAPDPKAKYPCERKYALLNPLFFVPPEQAYSIDYTDAVDGFDPAISSIKLNKKALDGLHFFAVQFRIIDCFISEPLLKALKTPPLHPLVRCQYEKSFFLTFQAWYNSRFNSERRNMLRK